MNQLNHKVIILSNLCYNLLSISFDSPIEEAGIHTMFPMFQTDFHCSRNVSEIDLV